MNDRAEDSLRHGSFIALPQCGPHGGGPSNDAIITVNTIVVLGIIFEVYMCLHYTIIVLYSQYTDTLALNLALLGIKEG